MVLVPHYSNRNPKTKTPLLLRCDSPISPHAEPVQASDVFLPSLNFLGLSCLGVLATALAWYIQSSKCIPLCLAFPVLRRSMELAASPFCRLPVPVLFSKSGIVAGAATPFLAVMPFLCPRAMSPLFLMFWDGWALSIFHQLLKGPLFCVSQDGEGGVVELTLMSLLLTRDSVSTCFLWLHRHMLSGREGSWASGKLVPFTPLNRGGICKVRHL